MLFHTGKRKFYAVALTPKREELLRKKFPSISKEVFDEVKSHFLDKGEYLEWALRQVAKNPEILKNPDIYNPDGLYGLKKTINWWEQAKTVQDPRIQAHPGFHPTGKWDIGAYSPETLGVMQSRYPTPVRARELFPTHLPPAKLLGRKENAQGVWELVQLDVSHVLEQAKREVYDAYNRIYHLLVNDLNVSVGYLGDILQMNETSIFIAPLAITFKTNSPQSLLPKEIDAFVSQNIFNPLGKSGWEIHFETSSHANNPGYTLIPASLAKVARLACQYGEGTKWCTTNIETARDYLVSAPLYIVLHDGYPVVQAWAAIEDDELQYLVMDRQDKALQYYDPNYEPAQELFKTHTSLPWIDWDIVQGILDDTVADIEQQIANDVGSTEDMDWVPSTRWNEYDYDDMAHFQRYMSRVHFDFGEDREEKEILAKFIRTNPNAEEPVEYLRPYVDRVLSNTDWADLYDSNYATPEDEEEARSKVEDQESFGEELVSYLNEQLTNLQSVIETHMQGLYRVQQYKDELGSHVAEFEECIETRDWDELLTLARQAGRYWYGFPSDFEQMLISEALKTRQG